MVELLGRHLHRAFNLTGVSKTLSSERITTEETPPALLEIEPAGALGNKHVLDARMVRQPGAGFQAVVTAQVVCNDENVPLGIVGFDVLEQFNVILGIARRCTARELLAIADTQRAIDPHLVIPAAVFQWSFDAMAVGRPGRGWRKGARDYWPEFVSADGRRSRWWRRVVGDDRRSFGTKSLSSLLPQLWV